MPMPLTSMKYPNWPKTGAILSIGQIAGTLEESDSYDFARELLCENSERSRALLKANSHPDFYLVRPIEENHAIKIDQIRDLIEWVQAKPQISTRKVALIYPAEAMNLQAANALLKTLEELALDTVFILVSLNPTTLPATIISRCHIIRSSFQFEDPKALNDPLQEQVAKDIQRLGTRQIEPVALAAVWLKQDINQLLYWFLVFLNKKIRLMLQDGHIAATQTAFDFLDKLYEAKRSLQEHHQLNKQLMLETLLIQYTAI